MVTSDPRKRRAAEVREFVLHLIVFVVANTFIVLQDLAISDGLQWAYWVFVPWGIGLIAHAVAVFVWSPAWMQRRLDEMEEKEKEHADLLT